MSSIKEKLKSILEGTYENVYIEEMALSKEEFEELYRLKKELDAEKTRALVAKDPMEKKRYLEKVDRLEERIYELRAKGLQ